jgi:hypothetical protein
VEKLTEPTGFSNNIGDNSILYLGAGARNSMLALRRPGDKVVA